MALHGEQDGGLRSQPQVDQQRLCTERPVRIRELLDLLPGEALETLCERRQLPTPRALDDRRSKLSRSYRGDMKGFLEELRRADLITLLNEVFYDGSAAYRLPGVHGLAKDELLSAARQLFSSPMALPQQMARSPGEDRALSVVREPGQLDRVLGVLPRFALVLLAEERRVPAYGRNQDIAGRIASTWSGGLVELLDGTLNRNMWNDIVEGLGGSRRKSFDEVATELLRLLDEAEAAEPAQALIAAPTATLPAATAKETLATPLQPDRPQAMLLHDYGALASEFERLCAWASQIAFIAPSIDTDGGRNRLWEALRRNLDKLEPSFLGVSSSAGDMIALRPLYRTGKLRLLPTLDATMQVHVWQFSADSRTAILSLSGPFGAANLVAPLTVATLIEGRRNADCGLASAVLFERAKSLAYVPDPGFPETYRDTVRDLRPSLQRLTEKVTTTFLRPTTVHGQERILRRSSGAGPSPRQALSLLQQALTDHAERHDDQVIEGSERRFTALWLSSLSLWARLQDLTDGMVLTFGVTAPIDGQPLRPLCRLECAFDHDETRSLAVRQDDLGHTFFVVDADGTEPRVLAPVDSSSLLRHLAAFVHDLARTGTVHT